MEVVVLELNPFDKWTSGALFDWDTDKEILHGDSPFEFRLHSEVQYHSPIRFLLPYLINVDVITREIYLTCGAVGGQVYCRKHKVRKGNKTSAPRQRSCTNQH